jgi:Asp-tRNA(Asn)/Glu-tRNA(Gln) amidotransferase B subunit
MIDKNMINRSIAKMILGQVTKTGQMPSHILEKMNASIIDNRAIISETIEKIFESEKSAVRDAKQNPSVTNYLLGKVMQLTGGRADPKIALSLIKDRLAKLE